MKLSIVGSESHHKIDSSFTWSDLVNAKKSMIIGIVLALLNQLCGCSAMMNYTSIIFKEAGSSVAPNTATIIIGVIQLVGSYMATFLVDRAGRKVTKRSTLFF